MFVSRSELARILCFSLGFISLNGIAAAEPRTWTDSTGKYSVVAELVSQSERQVVLKSSDGKLRTVERNRLCRKDLDFLRRVKNNASDSNRRAGPLDALVGQTIEISGWTPDGRRVDLQDFEGKVVLIDFWATWCGPCLREISNIAENYRMYHDSGFEVVAVSLDQDLGHLAQFVKSKKIPWTVLADQHRSNSGAIASRFGIKSIPAFILVGKDGTVIDVNCRGERLGQRLAGIFDR